MVNTDQPDQDAALAFLDEKVQAGTVSRVDTHASILFLEADRALKIKRAVKLPFLDYSTLDKRKHACDEELAVNRRHAPALYRRVIPITRNAGSFEIGGDGAIVEWAVEMARFDESKTLDHLAKAGDIKPELGQALADVFRDAHMRAETSGGTDWSPSIAKIIDRNTEKFRSQASLARDAVEILHELSRQRLAAMLPLLRERAARGFVRRCHGDGHLGNIVLIDGKPVLFDAIEFDPAIATTDVLYDLAFPLMDLGHFDLNAVASRLFNRHLLANWSECGDGLRLLPLFLSLRAAIRAHVLFTKCEQSPDDTHSAREARSYFDLALRLIEPARPSLIAIGGRSGTGKSALARDIAGIIAPPPGAVILRSDVIRKELHGVDPLEALPGTAYTAEVTANVYQTLLSRARRIVAQGFSVIIDAAFLRAAERDELAAAAADMTADFRPLFLDAPLAIRLARILSRRHDASDATGQVAADQDGYDIGRLDWPTLDASASAKRTLQRSLAVIRAR